MVAFDRVAKGSNADQSLLNNMRILIDYHEMVWFNVIVSETKHIQFLVLSGVPWGGQQRVAVRTVCER